MAHFSLNSQKYILWKIYINNGRFLIRLPFENSIIVCNFKNKPMLSQAFRPEVIYDPICAKSLPSCLTLCDPMDCSLPGSSVHGNLFHFKSFPWLSILKWTQICGILYLFFTACIFNTTKSLHAATKNTTCYKNDQRSLILQVRPSTAKKIKKDTCLLV